MRTILTRQARLEILLTLRRGEAVVLNLVVPLLALIGAGLTDVIRLPGDDRLGFVVPGVIGLAVMSTAFTGLAISTGYERSYGVLKRLGASPLTRWGLLTAKIAAVLTVLVVEVVILAGVGLALGWRPSVAGVLPALGVVTAATCAFAGFGFLLAGVLRAEATVGAATLIYLVMLTAGGVMFPLPGLGGVERLLPLAALTEGMRAALSDGSVVPQWCWYCLGAWAVIGIFAAARCFRWE